MMGLKETLHSLLSSRVPITLSHKPGMEAYWDNRQEWLRPQTEPHSLTHSKCAQFPYLKSSIVSQERLSHAAVTNNSQHLKDRQPQMSLSCSPCVSFMRQPWLSAPRRLPPQTQADSAATNGHTARYPGPGEREQGRTRTRTYSFFLEVTCDMSVLILLAKEKFCGYSLLQQWGDV